MMELANCCSWPSGTIPLNLYWPSVTQRMVNRCVSSLWVKVEIIFTSSSGFIIYFWVSGGCFYLAMYVLVLEDYMVSSCFLVVYTLGDGTVILRATIGGTGVSTLGVSGSLALCVVDVCTTLRGAPVLVRRSWNRVQSCLLATNLLSPMCENYASWLVYSYVSIKSAASRVARSAENVKVVFVLQENN